MSNQVEHINLKVKTEDVRAGLQKVIRSEHAHLISNVIIEHLGLTGLGVEHLILALSGIEVTPRFKVLDKVYVKFDSLPTWRMNKEKMIANKMIIKDCIEATVVEVDMLVKSPYKLTYNFMHNSDDEIHKDNYWMEESQAIVLKKDEI